MMLYKNYKFKFLEPPKFSICSFLNQQFFIYEFDKSLNMIQKIKIPQHIFKDFVEQFPRWEFEYLMPFRLKHNDLAFFQSYCKFKPTFLGHCIDVFVDVDSYYILNIKKQQLEPISRSYFQSLCKNFPKEYPDLLDSPSLDLLCKIIGKPFPKQAFFINKNLSLSIYQDEEVFLFKINHSIIYQNLFKSFEWYHQIDFETATMILRDQKIDFPLSKEAKVSFGYGVAQDLKGIKIALQYEDTLVIHCPTKDQKSQLEHFFYQALPNTNLLLGVYCINRNQYLVSKLYFNLYEDKDQGIDYYNLIFDLKLLSKQTLQNLFITQNGKLNSAKITQQEKDKIAQNLKLMFGENDYYLELTY